MKLAFCKWRIWLLSLVLFGWFATPARASDYCDLIGSELSSADIAMAQERLILLASVQHAELAQNVRIVNDGDTLELAPFVERIDGGQPTIRVPRGFKRLLCRLVQIQFRLQLGTFGRDIPTARVMADCARRGLSPEACVRSLFEAVRAISQLPQISERRSVWPEAELVVLPVGTDAALIATLLHEFAHFALRHSPRDDPVRQASQEAQADIYALTRVTISDNSPFAMFATFSTLSIVDPYLRGTGGPHGRFACRAIVTDAVIRALEEPTAKLHEWVTGNPVRVGRARDLPILGNTAGCPRLPPHEVHGLESDMRRMIAMLTASAARHPGGVPLNAAIEELLALPLTTDEARRLRMTLISVRLEGASEAASGSDRAAYRALIERLLAREEVSILMSEDYGRLLGRSALYAYQDGSSGSRLDAMLDRFRPRLERAVYFHPAFGDVHLQLGLGAYMSGRCEAGRRHLERVVALANDRNMVRAELGGLLLPNMNAATCAQATALLRRNTRNARGWRD